jgi:hypothetical protein
MQKRWASILISLGLVSNLIMPLTVGAQGVGGGREQAPGQNRGTVDTSFPVTGTGTTPAGQVADFAGTFVIEKFEMVSGQLAGVGSLSGDVTVAGVVTPVPARDVTLPVKSINGKPLPGGAVTETTDSEAADLTIAQVAACDILNLVLGPLHLDLLGLVVDLNQVILDITGQPGPGNLLGNLLCAITGLLDRTGSLGIILNLLNAIIDFLNLPG